MKKYVYDNATVYVTKITPEQEENIRRSTEAFVRTLFSKGLISDEYKRRNNRRVGRVDSNSRKRNSKTKKEDNSN